MAIKSPITLARIDHVVSELNLQFTELSERIIAAVDDRECRIINHAMANVARQIEDWELIAAYAHKSNN